MNESPRRHQLNAIKLRALVRDHLGPPDAPAPPQHSSSEGKEPDDITPNDTGEFGGGAALLGEGVAWVLLDEQPERGLGAALAWALRRDAAALHVLAERGTGLLAMIAEGGALPVVEHGVLAGEVDGLEVCRVVTDPYTDAVRLEVGVGAHDREAFQMLHGDRPTAEALADVVRSVGDHRRPGARPHPLNLLAQERALRALLVAQPHLIGATEVTAVGPPVPRANVKDAVPCVATATVDGRAVAVVCSSGVDIDVVPFAIDARAALGVEECLVVLPARDAIDIQRRLAAAATPPITVATVG